MHLFDTVNQDTNAEVMEATQKTRKHYWQHWLDFIPSSVNPYLQNVDVGKQLMVLQAFARWTREGAFGQGQQVHAGSMQTALCAIAKTIELVGHANPLHKFGTTNYLAALTMQTKAYKCEDPTSVKQLAVPVDVPN